MRKLKLTLLISLLTGMLIAGTPGLAHAAFNPNNLIDDSIFSNSGSMNVGSIDSFLNGFSSSCISSNNGFSAPDPTGYSPSGGYTFGGNVSAGHVIADAAAAYDINPQVLLATLQKEQSLVTGAGGCDVLAYAGAVGYGCPDGGTTYNYSGVNLYSINGTAVTSVNGTCVNSSLKVGFSQQLIRGAWLLKFGQQRSLGNVGWAIIRGSWDNSDDLSSCYGGPMTTGTFKVCPTGPSTFYDGYRTIDGQSVHMDTGATAGLYWYTPHMHGNQNFDDIFTGWFGAPYAPQYSWQEISQTVYTDNTKTNALGWNATLLAGQTAYVVITARNTGNQTWIKTGNNPVRLATWGPQDHASPFCSAGWITCNRPAMTNEASVAPGDVGTFEFPITAPNNSAVYGESFNLVAEGKAWFSMPGQYFQFNVRPPTYEWGEVGQTVFTDSSKTVPLGWNANIVAGQKVYVVLTARNNGNVTWDKNGLNPVHIATHNPQDRVSEFCSAWISCTRPAAPNEATVAPGQNATFEFWMQTPNRNGNFQEYFDLVAEGKTWMNPIGAYVGINASDPQYLWQPQSQTVYTDSNKTTAIGWNATITNGQSAWVVFRVKNTGNATWIKNGSPAVRMATWGPQDRTTAFWTPAWISANRAATHTEATVSPGQTGTFEFPITAPAPTGVYGESFNLVADGKAWMAPAGNYLILTVQ